MANIAQKDPPINWTEVPGDQFSRRPSRLAVCLTARTWAVLIFCKLQGKESEMIAKCKVVTLTVTLLMISLSFLLFNQVLTINIAYQCVPVQSVLVRKKEMDEM